MDSVKRALDEAISSWMKLSKELDKIEDVHSDELAEKCPFDKDSREVLRDLTDLKEG